MRKPFETVIALFVAFALIGAFPAVAKEKPPEPGKMKKLSFPSFKEFKTKNGIEVVVVEQHEQPLVTVAVVIKAGGALDPPEKAGLSDFTINLLNKGTKDKDATDLARWIESVGGEVEINSRDDWSSISISILSEYLDTAYQYLREIFFDPTFPEDELEEYRKRTKTALEIEKSLPSAVASRQFAAKVYGEHPYSKAPTVETVGAITREDVVDFYERYFVADNALFTVVGDVKWKRVRKDLGKYFGDLRRGEVAAIEFPAPPEIPYNRIFLFHKPGAVQTNIMVGHIGLEPGNPDWPAVTVANRILGGGADARLFMDLREKKGWTYGAYSRFSKPKDVGTFAARVEVRTEVTDSALVALLDHLKRMATEPVTDEELANAKNYLVGNFPLTIETPNQIANQVIKVKLLGLGKDYLEKYRERIAAVEAEDVQRAAGKYIHPDNLDIVLVGDATQIMGKVEKIAPVALFDLDGKEISLAELTVEPVHYEYNTAILRDVATVYSLKMQQMPLGDLTIDIKRTSSEGNDLIEITSTLSGMFSLEQKVTLNASDLSPLSYKSRMKAGPGVMASDLVFENGVAKGSIKGMKDKEPSTVEKELVEGAILDDQIEFVLAVLPLEVGKKYRFPTFETGSGGMSNTETEVMSEEKITVPAGEFETFKIRVKSTQGESFLYMMKKEPHLLVRQELPAQGLVVELKQISR